MTTRKFAKIIKLLDIAYDGETEENSAQWKANVTSSGVADGYAIDNDDSNCLFTKEFTTDEIEFVDLKCYNFMGSEDGPERFYGADWITVRERATGDMYAYLTEEIETGGF